MNKFLLSLLLFAPGAAWANPFKYKTPCYVETPSSYVEDVCTVVETRLPSGALNTRNIYSNRFGLTIKSRFDDKKGFVTWDSQNNFEYKWDYKVGNIKGKSEPHTYVMPAFLVENVSWD